MVKLCAFGEPSLFAADGTRLVGFLRHAKPFALLVYLACDHPNQPLRRDEVVAVFWPEADNLRGRNCLRQALHVLKGGLGDGIVVRTGDELLWVDAARLECDVRQFLLSLERGDPESALRLYRGEFLRGFHISGTPEFGFWAEEWRGRLRELAIHAAKNLAHTAEGERDLSGALFWWRKTLELAPFDEGAVRRLLALLAGSGNRCEALVEFKRFRQRMEDELGLDPSESTMELVALVSTASPAQIPLWVGDRRRKDPPDPAPRWRRIGNGSQG